MSSRFRHFFLGLVALVLAESLLGCEVLLPWTNDESQKPKSLKRCTPATSTRGPVGEWKRLMSGREITAVAADPCDPPQGTLIFNRSGPSVSLMNMKQRKLPFFFALLFTALFALPQAALAQQCYQIGRWQGNEVEYVKRQVVIQLAPSVTPSEAAPILNQQNVEIIDQFDELNWGLGQIPEGEGIFSVIEGLNRSPLIATAEPNVVGHLAQTPNDNHFSKQ